jgi:excisionase family DNA binding protein
MDLRKGYQWVTIQQAADWLGYSTSHIYQLMRTGKLNYKQVGRKRLVKLNRFHIPVEFREARDDDSIEGIK